jgi:hypothetical protein
LKTIEKHRAKLIGRYRRRSLLMLAALLALCSRTQADGGLAQIHQTAGPFVVTVFVAPSPPRIGPVDISVLAQDRTGGQAALDLEVFVRLRREGGMTLVGRATQKVAQNKLPYSVLMSLPEAGQWELEVSIKQGRSTASVLGQLSVTAPRPFPLSYWRSLSLPWIVVTLFAMNQWLKRRVASRERQNM